MREVPESIPGLVKSSLPNPGYWKVDEGLRLEGCGVVPGTRSWLDTSIDRSTRLGRERAAVPDLNPK